MPDDLSRSSPSRHRSGSDHHRHGSSTLSGALNIGFQDGCGGLQSDHGTEDLTSWTSEGQDHPQTGEQPATLSQWAAPPSQHIFSQDRSTLATALQWPSDSSSIDSYCQQPGRSQPFAQRHEMDWTFSSPAEVQSKHFKGQTSLSHTTCSDPFPFAAVSSPRSSRSTSEVDTQNTRSHQYHDHRSRAEGTRSTLSLGAYLSAGDRPPSTASEFRARTTTEGSGSGSPNAHLECSDAPSASSHRDPVSDAWIGSLFDPTFFDVHTASSDYASHWCSTNTLASCVDDPQASQSRYASVPGLTEGLQSLGLTLDQLTGSSELAEGSFDDSFPSVDSSADFGATMSTFDESWGSPTSVARSSGSHAFPAFFPPSRPQRSTDNTKILPLISSEAVGSFDDSTPKSSPILGARSVPSSVEMAPKVPPSDAPVLLRRDSHHHHAPSSSQHLHSSSPRPFISASQAASLGPVNERSFSRCPSASRSTVDMRRGIVSEPALIKGEQVCTRKKLPRFTSTGSLTSPRAKDFPSTLTMQGSNDEDALSSSTSRASYGSGGASSKPRQTQRKIDEADFLAAISTLKSFMRGEDSQVLSSIADIEKTVKKKTSGAEERFPAASAPLASGAKRKE